MKALKAFLAKVLKRESKPRDFDAEIKAAAALWRLNVPA